MCNVPNGGLTIKKTNDVDSYVTQRGKDICISAGRCVVYPELCHHPGIHP